MKDDPFSLPKVYKAKIVWQLIWLFGSMFLTAILYISASSGTEISWKFFLLSSVALIMFCYFVYQSIFPAVFVVSQKGLDLESIGFIPWENVHKIYWDTVSFSGLFTTARQRITFEFSIPQNQEFHVSQSRKIKLAPNGNFMKSYITNGLNEAPNVIKMTLQKAYMNFLCKDDGDKTDHLLRPEEDMTAELTKKYRTVFLKIEG
jgi:hypothetical protein